MASTKASEVRSAGGVSSANLTRKEASCSETSESRCLRGIFSNTLTADSRSFGLETSGAIALKFSEKSVLMLLIAFTAASLTPIGCWSFSSSEICVLRESRVFWLGIKGMASNSVAIFLGVVDASSKDLSAAPVVNKPAKPAMLSSRSSDSVASTSEPCFDLRISFFCSSKRLTNCLKNNVTR